ncbi:hypothetical protein, partial [Serratia marcescens]|uniref:hypothetical protein n=1 Tax=Serratia marcescens TaxID=615 RepID=UPI001A8ECE10
PFTVSHIGRTAKTRDSVAFLSEPGLCVLGCIIIHAAKRPVRHFAGFFCGEVRGFYCFGCSSAHRASEAVRETDVMVNCEIS